MPKGASQAEATLNSEEIKLVALAIIQLHLSEGIIYAVSQLVRQLVSRKFHFII